YPFLSADGYLASDPVAIVLHAAGKSNLLPNGQEERTRAISVVESSVRIFELLKKAAESDAVERELIISEQIPPCLARVEVLMRAKGLPEANVLMRPKGLAVENAFDISDVACDVLCWALTESKQQCFRREDVEDLYPTIAQTAKTTNQMFIDLTKSRCLGVCDNNTALD
ncbi:hypothetical protein GNI_034210, partial [Gregarina niphandrodes]